VQQSAAMKNLRSNQAPVETGPLLTPDFSRVQKQIKTGAVSKAFVRAKTVETVFSFCGCVHRA